MASLSRMAAILAAPACAAVVDLVVIEGEHSACPENFGKVHPNDGLNGDLNQGAGGQYIYLCVQTGVTDQPITDLTVVAEGGSEGGCGDLGGDWHRVQQAQGSNGDLNHGAGGKYIYLCYRKQAGRGPILDLNLNKGDCGGGFFRAPTDKDSNGDLNQGAGGEYIYLCASRGCSATSVEGKWVIHGGQIAGETSEDWTIGTHQSTSETKTEDWQHSVSVKVSQGWKFEGAQGGVEITGTISHETSTSYTSAWSEDDSHTYKVTYSAKDRGKQPWQFQFSPSDTCGNKVQSNAQTLAITEGAFRPPCCVPGFATDAPAYKTCHSKETMVAGGAAYGCKVAKMLNVSNEVFV
jgi:hypothetical protein